MNESCSCAIDEVSFVTPTILDNIKLVLVSVVATCIAIFTYNYSLQQKYQVISDKEENDTNRPKRPEPKQASRSLTTASPRGLPLGNETGTWAEGDFLSAILSQVWHHANIAISNTIKESITPILNDLPVPIHLIKVDLGNVPIQTTNMFIQKIKTKGPRPKERIQIDFDLNWDGESDIILQATMSKSVKLTFGVKHIKLKGRFSLLLGPLTSELPIVSAVQYGFTNPPEIDLSFSGCVKSLDKLVFVGDALKGVIDSTLAGMLVLPYRMGMPIDLGGYDFLETYTPPVGMLRVGVKSGRGFKILKKLILNDIPDVYCVVSLGASKPFRNTTKYDSLNPQWPGETKDFILYDLDQKIYVSVYDEDKGPMDPDDLLGKCEITAKDLLENDGQVELELTMNDEKTGAFVTIDAEMFSLSKSSTSFMLPEFEGENKLCGLLTIIVTKAFGIPLPKEDCATMVKVVFGKGQSYEETFWTGTVADYPGVDAVNPMYDAAFHVPLTQKMLDSEIQSGADAMIPSQAGSKGRNSTKGRNSIIGIISRSSSNDSANLIEMTLIDGDSANGIKGRGELGSISISYKSLMEAHNHTITETCPIGTDGARLEFKAVMSGIQCDDDEISDLDTSEVEKSIPINDGRESQMVLLTALRGRGFEIRKRGFGRNDDVPDVYLCIPQLSWKTSVCKDDTMPQWNESKLFVTTNSSRTLRVDAYDKDKTKDDYIGTAIFPLDQLLRSRTIELELQHESKPTSSFVTMQCVLKSSQDMDGYSCDALRQLPTIDLNLEKVGSGEDQSLANQTIKSNLSMSSKRLFGKKSLSIPKAIGSSVPSLRKYKRRNSINGPITEAKVEE